MLHRRLAALALGAAATLLFSGCAGGDGSGADDPPTAAPRTPAGVVAPAGDGRGYCMPGTSLGFLGTSTGPHAALSSTIANAAQLAVDEHNQANPECQVRLVRADSGSSKETAAAAASEIIDNTAVLGIVGLPTAAEYEYAGTPLNSSGIASISPSVQRVSLTQRGWRTFFRALGNDAVQGEGAARFVHQRFAPQRVCVLKDGSPDAAQAAQAASRVLGPAATGCQLDAPAGQAPSPELIGAIRRADPQAIFYSGSSGLTAPLVRQLRDAGVQAQFVAAGGVMDQQTAGGAADGTFIICSCVPQEGFTAFADAYRQRFGVPPSAYSAETYDAATVMLRGLDRGINNRTALLEFIRFYSGQGLSKRIGWTRAGEPNSAPVYAYRVEGGRIVTESNVG